MDVSIKRILETYKIPIAIVVGFALLGIMLRSSSRLPAAVPSTENIQAQILSSPEGSGVATPSSTAAPNQAGSSSIATVTFVVDGDTVELLDKTRVRLIGIDSPERGDHYYSEARSKLVELIQNKEIRLEKDVSETDRYGRLVRYIYLGEMFVNLEMVRSGYAKAYTYPPDIKYSSQIAAAERETREAQRGLWAPVSIPKETAPSRIQSAPAAGFATGRAVWPV
jgi:micrococcal nuclease